MDTPDRLRYGYEDGRGGKVWVQNLKFDLDTNCSEKKDVSPKARYVDIWHQSRFRPRGAAYRAFSAPRSARMGVSPADKQNKSLSFASNATPLRRSASARAETPVTAECTCDCPIHGSRRKVSTECTAISPEFMASLIHTTEEAERILEELRREERVLLLSCAP